MTSLKHPSTGHVLRTDEKSVEFWKAAGYEEIKAPAKKAAVKKSSSDK